MANTKMILIEQDKRRSLRIHKGPDHFRVIGRESGKELLFELGYTEALILQEELRKWTGK